MSDGSGTGDGGPSTSWIEGLIDCSRSIEGSSPRAPGDFAAPHASARPAHAIASASTSAAAVHAAATRRGAPMACAVLLSATGDAMSPENVAKKLCASQHTLVGTTMRGRSTAEKHAPRHASGRRRAAHAAPSSHEARIDPREVAEALAARSRRARRAAARGNAGVGSSSRGASAGGGKSGRRRSRARRDGVMGFFARLFGLSKKKTKARDDVRDAVVVATRRSRRGRRARRPPTPSSRPRVPAPISRHEKINARALIRSPRPPPFHRR